ncbi:MAG TPA: hypothetical protein V6C72_19775, partial [Chroococcales cyanobacterium]
IEKQELEVGKTEQSKEVAAHALTEEMKMPEAAESISNSVESGEVTAAMLLEPFKEITEKKVPAAATSENLEPVKVPEKASAADAKKAEEKTEDKAAEKKEESKKDESKVEQNAEPVKASDKAADKTADAKEAAEPADSKKESSKSGRDDDRFGYDDYKFAFTDPLNSLTATESFLPEPNDKEPMAAVEAGKAEAKTDEKAEPTKSEEKAEKEEKEQKPEEKTAARELEAKSEEKPEEANSGSEPVAESKPELKDEVKDEPQSEVKSEASSEVKEEAAEGATSQTSQEAAPVPTSTAQQSAAPQPTLNKFAEIVEGASSSGEAKKAEPTGSSLKDIISFQSERVDKEEPMRNDQSQSQSQSQQTRSDSTDGEKQSNGAKGMSIVKDAGSSTVPDWCKKYFAAELVHLSKELNELNDQVRIAQQKIKEVESRVALTKGMRNTLLTAQGEELVEACGKVLTMLGWKVKIADDDRHELRLDSDDKNVAIARIVWTEKEPDRSHLGQLSISQTRYWCEQGVEPKGILIVSKPGENGPSSLTADQTSELSEYASKKNVCLMTTLQLLA